MQAAVRPNVMAGVALAGASLIAVTPIVSPPDLPRLTNAAVRLTSGEDLLGSLTSIDPLASLGGLFDSGSPLNIPYNLFADLVSIPYYESLALQEYAYALGAAGTVGGVADWIPPGATVANGGVEIVNELPYYALGGTGSWWMQSIGNTWGWDDGNWPQLAGLLHFFLPFQFTLSLAEQLQIFAQAEFIDGARVGCEFECADVLGYLGGWLHGETPLASLLAGTTFPDTIQGDIGDPFLPVIWAGEPAQLNPLAPLEAIAANLTASPADNPILLPDPANVISSFGQLFNDALTNFNPFVTGSFGYWGAPTLYSVPALLAGLLERFTGIPNQFVDIGQWAPLGSEPTWGPDAGPLSLIKGVPQGFEYLAQGLLGYLNPNIYLEAINNDLSLLTNPAALLDLPTIPLIGYLFDPSTLGLGSFGPGALLGSFDPATLLGSFDPATLLGSFDPSALLGSIGPDLATNLAALLPNVGADLASLLGQEFAVNFGSLIPQLLASFLPF